MSYRRLLWIGALASKQRLQAAFATDPMPQVSAVKFQMSLLEGFASHGVSIDVLGALPIVPFPRAKTILVAADPFDTGYPEIGGTLMWDVNLPIVRMITRFIASLQYGARLLKKSRGTEGIVVYPLHTPFLAAAIVLKKIFKLPIFIFIPDLPAHTSGGRGKGLAAFARAVNDRLLNALVSNVDLAFPITAQSAREWLPPSVKYLVVEGIAPGGAVAAKPPRRAGGRRMLYTGQFSEVARFAQLFADNREIDGQLIFVGDGPDAGELARLAQADNRIEVKPFMTGPALEKEFADADFLLNPRDSYWEGAKYSFPSKLHDYMARGRPVLSTRMPGIPDEYFDCFFAVSDADSSSFSSSLKKALGASEEEISRRIAIGETMLGTTKSPRAVVARILDAMSAAHRPA